jgi:uncharacterized protein YndB with AHSA1/START domain
VASEVADRDVVIARVLAAPHALVFEAWTQPEHVVHWWQPEGLEPLVCEAKYTPDFMRRGWAAGWETNLNLLERRLAQE